MSGSGIGTAHYLVANQRGQYFVGWGKEDRGVMSEPRWCQLPENAMRLLGNNCGVVMKALRKAGFMVKRVAEILDVDHAWAEPL